MRETATASATARTTIRPTTTRSGPGRRRTEAGAQNSASPHPHRPQPSRPTKTTAHVLRHTFATSLVRGGADLVIVAELLGHARLETVRIYTQPTEDDKIRALDHLITDE